LRYACDLTCDYLEDSLKIKLQSTLGLPTDLERQKRKMSDVDEGTKRLKMDDCGTVTPLEDYGSPNTAAKGTAKVCPSLSQSCSSLNIRNFKISISFQF